MSPDFKALLALDSLPPAFLFIGTSQAREAAQLLAKKLLNTSHLFDFHSLTLEGKSAQYSFQQIQKLIEELYFPPYSASCKVFYIEEADRIPLISANALLKTLEEPPADTFLILSTSKPEKLLPTLLSRLWKVHFPEEENNALEEPLRNLFSQFIKEKKDYSHLYSFLFKVDELLENETPAAKQEKIDFFLTLLLSWVKEEERAGSLEKKYSSFFQQAFTQLYESLQLQIKPKYAFESFFLKVFTSE